MCTSDIFLGLIAILFPPIAVWIKRSICSADSLINILLCTLGYIPGLLHAWYIIAAYPEPRDDYDALPGDGGETGPGAPRVTYYYVNRRDAEAAGSRREGAGAQREGAAQRGYGTTEGMGQSGPSGAHEEGLEQGGVPPSYEQAVRGDHKVQT